MSAGFSGYTKIVQSEFFQSQSLEIVPMHVATKTFKDRHSSLGIAGSVSGYDSRSSCTKFLGSSFGYFE